MKIVILSDYFDDKGGAVGIAKATAFGLKNFGHDVSVITTIQDKSLAGKRNENGVNIYSIYSKYDLFWRAYISLRNPQTVGEIKRIINKLKPDIAHAHNIHTHLSYYSLKIAKQSGAKVFLTAHDVMLFHYGKLMEVNYKTSIWQRIKRAGKTYNPFRNIIIRYYLKYVDKIFAVSNALKEALSANGISNIEVIHNGIDVNDWIVNEEIVKEFKRKYNLENNKIIFLGGRMTEEKISVIMATMKIVIKSVPQAELLIAAKINGTAEKIPNVTFTGWLTGKQLKASYWASEIVVVPSTYFDSFPTINLEAMACGKPVIATCFGGSREAIIDGETGYIVNPFNIEELAEKIVYLLKNPEVAKKFGDAGYERVKKEFNLEKMINNYLAWYKKNL